MRGQRQSRKLSVPPGVQDSDSFDVPLEMDGGRKEASLFSACFSLIADVYTWLYPIQVHKSYIEGTLSTEVIGFLRLNKYSL